MGKELEGVDWQMIEALYLTGVRPSTIAAKTGVKLQTISARACRKGWSVALTATRNEVNRAYRGIQSRSLALKDSLANDLANSAAALAKVPCRANLKDLKRRAEVIEPLARTAKLVFDWGNDKPGGLVVMGTMRALEATPAPEPTDAQPLIEVEASTAEPEPPKEIPLTDPEPAEPPGDPL